MRYDGNSAELSRLRVNSIGKEPGAGSSPSNVLEKNGQDIDFRRRRYNDYKD